MQHIKPLTPIRLDQARHPIALELRLRHQANDSVDTSLPQRSQILTKVPPPITAPRQHRQSHAATPNPTSIQEINP
ncbi:hypothetical protein ENSA7_04320 [Enhygromyxa salina]|uniref:Uncharacterized protein n=1 Tax=Enhygromyxa salina TaxID=215803 RepID=A0A2S9YXR5_9BACT|nr:hypothetical protein ENSA7_04320 [Enhygromyxa salina]